MKADGQGLIRHKFHSALLALGLTLIIPAPVALAVLNPGDIAIIGYQSDDPDKLAFVALVPIDAGEVIRFTDNGWQSTNNNFRPGEGGVQYAVPIPLPAGTVIMRTAPFSGAGDWSVSSGDLTGTFQLAVAGDQIFAFQGAANTPQFLYALNYNGAGWVASATTSNNTALPSALTDGQTALNLGLATERDNGYYNGTTTGSPAQLLAAIGNPANWVTSNNPQTWPNWSFQVSSNFPAVSSVVVAGGPFNVGDSTTVTVSLSAAPDIGSPATVSVSSAAFTASQQVVISNPDTQGAANVTFGTAGTHTATASAVSQCTGSAISSSLIVNAPPTAPVANAGPDRTLNLSGGSVAILFTDATATDVNGLTGLTYAWTPVSGSGIVGWTNRTGAVTDPTSPAEAQVTVNATGVYVFTLTVTDPTALIHTDTVSITVVNAPPIGQYDEPPTYYDPARPGGVWLVDGALKTALNGIISNHTVRTYDSARQSLQLLDLDPGNSANVVLAYTGISVPKPWDAGVTWNREHLWPQSLFPGTSDLVSDLFNLRTCNPVINSTRGNNPYGIGGGYWDPDHGAPDRGDCARSLFYDATCYMSEVTLVNGQPGTSEMGDLAKLLEWHFSDPVNEIERRRNHLIYSAVDNPSYHQANRNPYIDHPELVWSVFGGSNNNSRLYVGATNPPTGASALTVDLGRVIKNSAVPTAQSTTLTKTGSNPTTYAISLAGSAASSAAGLRQTFAAGSSSRSIDCGLSTTTATAGLKSGTITIDNTDVSSSAAGNGSADGNDVVTVNLSVVEHANASFVTPADQNGLTLDFGTVAVGSGPQVLNFIIYNLDSAPGFTAALDLDAVNGTGNTAVLGANVLPIANLQAGVPNNYQVTLDTSAPGSFTATYTIVNSDENIAGAANGVNLVLTLLAVVQAPTCNAVDVDCNTIVEPADIAAFIDLLINGTTPCSACAGDMNGDSLRDGRDIAGFVQAIVIP